MMLAGDEMGRTQHGNNNAYCQDNEISWVDWARMDSERDLVDFTRALAALRRDHPVFRRRRFFRGHQPGAGSSDGPGDIVWLTPAGREVTDSDWRAPDAKSLAVFLNGDAISEPDPRGERITDDRFLLLFNAAAETVSFSLPGVKFGREWEIVIDTCGPRVPILHGDLPLLTARAKAKVAPRAVMVLRSRSGRA